MWQMTPKKHPVGRRADFRVPRYPFRKMIVNDYFEDDASYESTIRVSATRANRVLSPKRFSVNILDNKVRCTRVA